MERQRYRRLVEEADSGQPDGYSLGERYRTNGHGLIWAYGQLRASNERKKGFLLSGWCPVYLDAPRPGNLCQTTPSLRGEGGVRRLILTEAQLVAMEKEAGTKRSHREIETEHPGYLGAQDTYYGAHHQRKWIYQQTIDTYSKVALQN